MRFIVPGAAFVVVVLLRDALCLPGLLAVWIVAGCGLFFLGCSVSLLARALVASGPDCLCWSAVGNLIFLFGLVGVCSPMLFEFYFALHEGCSCFCS